MNKSIVARLSLAFLLLVTPGLVLALGIGKLQLESALNEPFEAQIELLSATVDEIDTLSVSLANQAAFDRAGIPRLHLLTQLEFAVKENELGPDYIRIYSVDPIREPFLNFLLEISWSKGRLFREYTVLLDPPIYAAKQKRQKRAVTPAPVIHPGFEDHVVVYDPVYKPPAPAPSVSVPARPIQYSGGDYGPTVTGDTLWSIASAMRPDSSVSIQQMMLALLRTNPEAFINNNINGLKRGHVLEMPEISDIQSVKKEAAFIEAKQQNESWDQTRGITPAVVEQRPEGAPSAGEEKAVTEQPPVAVEAEPEGEPELRLVAAGEGPEAAEGAAGKEALAQQLALVNESLEALKQENAELQDKLLESDTIIEDLKRLIVLKEDEFAALQQQIAAAEAVAEEVLEEAPVTEVEEPVVEEEIEEEAVTEVEEPVVEGEIEEEAVVAEEEPTEEVSEELPEEVAVTEPVGDFISSLIPSGLSGLVAPLKNNLMLVAGGAGGLLLVIFLALFAMRRRGGEQAEEIPASAFPDFDDMETEVGADADATDISPELEQSEAATALPESDEGDYEKTEFVGADEEPQFEIPAEEESAPAAEAPAMGEDEDPMAEVNVFLAYEHFDQAEEFVKKAIGKEPDNLEYHNKLLEVYYAANNKKGYEEAAKVLHDKVGGEGDYWSMAVAMWQELSPNRALFEEAVEDEEEVTETGGGGIVDITGEAADESADAVLDVTTTEDEEADILDVTAAVDAGSDEDLLDVTAAVDMDDVASEENEVSEDSGLDFSLDTANEEEVLDVTAGAEAEESLDAGLDFSLGESQEEESESLDLEEGTEEVSSDESMLDEDSLDISLDSATAGSEEVLDLTTSGDADEAEEKDLEFSLDFDAGAETSDAGEAEESDEDPLDATFAISMGGDKAEEEEADEDLLDVSQSSSGDLLDVTSAADFVSEDEDLLDVTSAAATDAADEDQMDIEISESEAESATDAEEIGLDFELSPNGDVSEEASAIGSDTMLDIASGEESDSGLDIELDIADADEDKVDASEEGSGIDLEIPEDNSSSEDDSAGFSLDIEETGLAADDDHTVLVPPKSSEKQSEEDEIASQLDLAKAYIELGDTDNAKTILDEIVANGNEQQRTQAQELLGQIS